MSRIQTHTIDDAPAASQALLQKIAESTPGGRPANLHAQMAHSPAILTAYSSLRAALTEHTAFDPKASSALTLAAAAGVGNEYMIRIAGRLAQMNGWTEEQVTALRAGAPTNDVTIDALTRLVRDAASNSGNVSDPTWNAARHAGWTDRQLADAYAYVGAMAFTGYFLNYAQTDIDV
jgi:alkylhydroperoxidase family enzyme